MVELYPHQEKAVKELHNGSILFADVGVGKTITAAAYYMENEAPRNVIVITTAKKRDTFDWQRDFGRYGVGRTEDCSVAGTLTVDSWNNIGKYRDLADAFFIFDEQRLVGSGQWTKDFIRIARHNRWILLSATPGDTWLDYIPVFVANGLYKNRTEFLREHVIYSRWSKFPKVERYVNVNKLVKYRNQILVHMPLERHTTRKVELIPVDYDKESFDKVMIDRWHIYSGRPLRDVAELFLVMRKVVNSSPSRLEAIRLLTQKHPRLIVFYNFDYELEALRSLVSGMSKEKKSETTQEREEWTSKSLSRKRSTTASSGLLRKNSNSPFANTKSSYDEPSSKAVETPSAVSSVEGSSTTEISTRVSTTTTSTTTSGDVSPKKKSTTSDDSLRKDSEEFSTRSMLPTKEKSSLQVAEWNGHKHQPVPTSDRWIYLVQYQAGSEGWNCTDTDAMVFYSLTYSYKNWHQAHGRIDRLNTPFETLYYYVLMSNSIIDKAIMGALKSKKSFNESKWLRSRTTMDSQKTPKAA